MATKVGYSSASAGLLTDIDTAARNVLGTRQFDDAGNEYIYLGGVASLAAGDWVFYNSLAAQSPFLTARLPASTATFGLLAVAMAAVLATQFGWFQIYGLTPANTAIATDASGDGKGLSAASGTLGQMKTGPTATKNVFNAVVVGNPAANVGRAFISYPYEFGSSTI